MYFRTKVRRYLLTFVRCTCTAVHVHVHVPSVSDTCMIVYCRATRTVLYVSGDKINFY
jgi:hypothetical protein